MHGSRKTAARHCAVLLALLATLPLTGCQLLRQIGQMQTITYGGRLNPPDETRVYKLTPTRELRMHVFMREDNLEPLEPLVPVLLIHGGGFTHGWPAEFFPLAEDLAKRGHIGFVPEYRIRSKDDTLVPEALADVRDSIDWVIEHARDFGADPEMLVLGGSSAGAHLIAAAVTIPDDEQHPFPHAIGLFLSAAYVDSTGFSKQAQIEEQETPSLISILRPTKIDIFAGRSDDLSPSEHIHPNMPPTLMLLGANDKLAPTAQTFCKAINEAGSQCTIKLYKNAGHAYALTNYPAYPDMLETLSKAITTWKNQQTPAT